MPTLASFIMATLLAAPVQQAHSTAFEQPTLGAIVKLCQNAADQVRDQATSPQSGKAIVEGIRMNERCFDFIDGFVAAEAAMRDKPTFCNPLPGNRYAHFAQAAAIVNWGSLHVDRLSRPAGPEIIAAFIQDFPCH